MGISCQRAEHPWTLFEEPPPDVSWLRSGRQTLFHPKPAGLGRALARSRVCHTFGEPGRRVYARSPKPRCSFNWDRGEGVHRRAGSSRLLHRLLLHRSLPPPIRVSGEWVTEGGGGDTSLPDGYAVPQMVIYLHCEALNFCLQSSDQVGC